MKAAGFAAPALFAVALVLVFALDARWGGEGGPVALPTGQLAWDLFNGAGVAATLVLVYLARTARRTPRPGELSVHKGLAWVGLTLVAVHGVGILVSDPIARWYFDAHAPDYMLAGIVASVLLTLLVVTSYRSIREKVYTGYRPFAGVHRWGWWITLALILWHVVGSGFYLASGIAVFAFLLVAGLPALIAARGRASGRGELALEQSGLEIRVITGLAVLVTLGFAAMRMITE